MDRHICKAKRKDNGEWVQGYYYKQTHFYGDESERYYIITSTEALDYDQALEYFEVDPNTICSCTGLLDKNGTIIFENDCIGHRLNVVEYMNGDFCINGDTPLSYMNKYYEVVGNRFNNTKLLEN